ncbi:hypothetical protein Ddc_20982 [Ditylenchus destructor]|nr:hypothetical protein Ddc_20982 [Ditylenchus destructor]
MTDGSSSPAEIVQLQYFSTLPLEVLNNIYQFFPVKEGVNIMMVSRQFSKLTTPAILQVKEIQDLKRQLAAERKEKEQAEKVTRYLTAAAAYFMIFVSLFLYGRPFVLLIRNSTYFTNHTVV